MRGPRIALLGRDLPMPRRMTVNHYEYSARPDGLRPAALPMPRRMTVNPYEYSARPQRSIHTPIQSALCASRADVVQRKGRDDGIARRQRRSEKAVDDQ